MCQAQELAERNTILRAVVGSTLHGLSVSEQDDRDEMGVCVEPWAHFLGLRPKFEQWTYRTQPEGKRSGPGDLDLVIYSLAKWMRLALGGNPTILTLLFVPDEFIVEDSPLGVELRSRPMRRALIGDNIFGPYLGYMRQQRSRMERSVKMPNRPELVERYGYDTKYAGHLLRLGYQGVQLAKTGEMTLPMAEPTRSRIVDVRLGKYTKEEVLEEARFQEEALVELQQRKPLPPPDRELVESWVVDVYDERGAL